MKNKESESEEKRREVFSSQNENNPSPNPEKTPKKTKKPTKKSITLTIIIVVCVLVFAFLLEIGGEVLFNALKYKNKTRNNPVAGGISSSLFWVLEHPTETHPKIDFSISDITQEQLAYEASFDMSTIQGRYDKMDFACTRLYRLKMDILAVKNLLPDMSDFEQSLDQCLLSMKFWITENGEDSVCYYSENHQITYFALEYLLGRLYPDKIFTNDGKTGREKEEEGKRRIEDWLSLRAKFGFSEFNSVNYYPYDIQGLAFILLYGDKTDELLRNRCKSALDLLLLDYACCYNSYTAIGPQGRAYPRNNFNTAYLERESDIICDYLFESSRKFGDIHYYIESEKPASAFFRIIESGDYNIPEIIFAIGKSTEPLIIETSQGVDLSYMAENNLISQSEKDMMLQLGMGALTNKEVITNTMNFVRENHLFQNDFVSAMKYLNVSFLRLFNLYPSLSENLNLFSNGMAIERANIYSYKTADYKLSSLQNYNVGGAGAQQTIMMATLSGKATLADKRRAVESGRTALENYGITVFTTHPLREDNYTATPGYWAGYGVTPDCRQSGNICMMVYDIPLTKPTFAPSKMLSYTHTYFPTELFDYSVVEGKYAFCQVGDTYLAIIGTSDWEQADYDTDKANKLDGMLIDTTKSFELIQRGRKQGIIYEISDKEEEGSFSSFMARIKANALSFGKKSLTLTYQSGEKSFSLIYDKSFSVDGKTQSSEYGRIKISSATNGITYTYVDYLSTEVIVEYGGKRLITNCETGHRED